MARQAYRRGRRGFRGGSTVETVTRAEPAFRWRPVIASALLPSLLFATGEGAIIPVIPQVAVQLGGTLAAAGIVAAMLLVGTLLGDIPSGVVVARIGERQAMIAAAIIASGGLGLALLARTPWVLALGILLVGVATASFGLARHAFLTTFVPIAHRARALSTLGGTFRLGYLIGPFLGAGIIALTASAASVFWFDLACCLATAVVLLVLPDPATTVGEARPSRTQSAPVGLFRTIRENARVLGTLGVGSALVAALRGSRQVILPLWAVSIGMHESTASIVLGVAGAVDFALFYAGGQIMDRFGRLWTAVPSMVGLGVGHLLLALTSGLPTPVLWFVTIAMLLSLANGIGAGILMTLGADLADPTHPAPFLGAWRFCNDTGGAAAPLLIAAVTALASLPVAAAVLGVLGIGGAVVLRVFVPRYSPHR
ncbi:MAG: MFS transporter [Micrococcales bacterium]|nr:MFS transporter [Micrococcales bacterium]